MKKLSIGFGIFLLCVGIMLGVQLLFAQTIPSGWNFTSASTSAGCVANATTIASLCAVANDGAYLSISGGAFTKVAVGAVAVIGPVIPAGNLVKSGGGNLLVDGGVMPGTPSLTSLACPNASLSNTGLAGSNCVIK